MKISIETLVNASLENVWSAWVTPNDIVQWNFASDDWICPKANIELVVGGKFNYRMEAKDGSFGFDFEGRFTSIIFHEQIEYVLDDDRKVLVTFTQTNEGVKLVETFEAESENSGEQQKQGWLSILNNFKQHVEQTRV
ncbi:SRPBCC family protein [Psychrosphaera aquimarina]|uniref:SRPBCC family protein n=1 Tax=Psychrosphaera aquimarina TaxID=2044854 RepID=A0ABU3QZ08_9GAMM|nr:SRPBCC family protein [Psychrosphaera aquimarina]MDU0112370.1 SRPBCC family protein [Psychrosphaera aquimarina]